MSLYKELSKLDVSEYTEDKGKFTYLSWAYAVQELLKRVPDAEWDHPDPTVFADGSMMVYCHLTCNGITRRAYLPVTNHQNNAIVNPDCFAINTAMQRCLAKAIALHGLGLYIYAGEDLPTVTDYDMANEKIDQGDPLKFQEWVESLSEEQVSRVYGDAPNGHKVKFKAKFDDELRKAEAIIADYHTQLTGVIERRDAEGFAQLWDEMTASVKGKMNARLNGFEKETAKELMAQLGGVN